MTFFRAKWILLSLLIISTIYLWLVILEKTNDSLLRVSFLDIGQGDSIFIEAPNGNQVLIDGGANRQVLQQLAKQMPFYDRSLDLVIATHSDLDHIGGLPFVFDRYKVAGFMEPGVRANTSADIALILKAKKAKNYILARRGMRVVLEPDIYFDILFPDRDPVGMETNTASVVGRLTYGETSFLLTGDSPSEIETYLVNLDAESLSADVLKAGHHGSKTSTSDRFVAVVNPELAIISAGRDNRYGHPHQVVLDTLARYGVSVLNTANQGVINLLSDGRQIVVEN